MITDWVQALILGVVQGLTEFIPISSSGHLVLLPYVLGWQRPGLAFDVALHAGTAGAIVLYFRRDLLGMARAVLGGGGTRESRMYRRMVVLLAVASVPVAIVGVTLKSTFERIFETPPVAAGLLFVTAAVLVGGERLRARRVERTRTAATPAAGDPDERVWTGDWVGDVPAEAPDAELADPWDHAVGTDLEDPAGTDLEGIGLREALTVGCAQTLALLPGMSRSGTTIMAGIAGGMTREAATRFSFLLALPAMVGALILSVPDLGEPSSYSGGAIAVGVLAAFVAGYAAIAFLLRLVAHTSLTVFARYLVVAGALGLFAYVMIGPPSTV